MRQFHVPPGFLPGLGGTFSGHRALGHFSGELDTPAKYEAHRLQLAQKFWAELRAKRLCQCRSCHTPSAMALAKQPAMAADAHSSLAKSGMTCIDCHKGVRTPRPTGS